MDTFEEQFFAAGALLGQNAELEIAAVELPPDLVLSQGEVPLEQDQDEGTFIEERPKAEESIDPDHLSAGFAEEQVAHVFLGGQDGRQTFCGS